MDINGSNLTLKLTESDLSNSTTSVKNISFTDHNDGTYSVFMSSHQGYISYNIYISGSYSVSASYWENMYMTGDYDYICTYDQISFDWGMGNITPTARDGVSTRFEGKIVAPESNTYTFYLTHDDGARLLSTMQ